MLALSFVSWLLKGRALLVRSRNVPSNVLLLWLLYPAFASLLALSVLLDVAGVLSANLQVRLFPYLMVVAIPLASEVLAQCVRRVRRSSVAAHWTVAALLALCVLYFSGASLLKATSDPLLSDNWVFYSTEERRAMEWTGTHLRNTSVWIGPGGRLRASSDVHGGWSDYGIEVDANIQASESRYVLVSDAIEMLTIRLQVSLPDTRAHLKVYDSGDVSFYQLRPRTPYQR